MIVKVRWNHEMGTGAAGGCLFGLRRGIMDMPCPYNSVG